MTVDRVGRFSLWEAPRPWGPWTRVYAEQNTSRWGTKVVIFTFVNKWLSADGLDFVIVHTHADGWATAKGRFTLY